MGHECFGPTAFAVAVFLGVADGDKYIGNARFYTRHDVDLGFIRIHHMELVFHLLCSW